MKALFVSHSLPPFADSQTIRNVFLIKELCRNGFEVTLVRSPYKGGDASLKDYLPSQILEVLTKEPFFDKIERLIALIPHKKLRKYMRSANAVLLGRVMFPDMRADWGIKAYQAAVSEFKKGKPDVIISSSGSYSAHCAASRLAAEYGIPWVADYGDPWTLNPLPPMCNPGLRAKNEKIERKLLQNCSGITVTTEQTKQLYENWLEHDLPIEVIPCGYEKPLLRKEKRDSKKIAIGYIGSASRSNRDLRSILSVINEVGGVVDAEVSLYIIGSYSPFFEREAVNFKNIEIQFIPWVTFNESLEYIANLDALILYGNSKPIQVPAKTFYYLASQNPILYVGQIKPEEDPTYEIIKDVLGVCSVFVESDNFEKDVHEFFINLGDYSQLAEERILRNKDFFEEYDWQAIGLRYVNFIKNVLGCL